ncbi:hypothetical protein L226DRAFT_550775 [Lentinus tigrinus ALCF2SS1-7]|nr:hypothetical protein L226DRAFT_550775 [Lentinus tigrinus ALCF2SS1-7]
MSGDSVQIQPQTPWLRNSVLPDPEEAEGDGRSSTIYAQTHASYSSHSAYGGFEDSPYHDVPSGYVPVYPGVYPGGHVITPQAVDMPQAYGYGYPRVPPGGRPLSGGAGTTDAQNARLRNDDASNNSDAGAKPQRNDVPRAWPEPPPIASAVPGPDMWAMYLQQTTPGDKEDMEAWNVDLDSDLIFAALFSAVLTTFIVESSKSLQPDNSEELLRAILLQVQTSRNGTTVVPAPFKLAPSAVRVNVYWFCSLVISLSAALIAILAKQWLNYLHAGLSPIPATRARYRQFRIEGTQKWRLPSVISFIPIMLHISLLLFFVGLVEFVWPLNEAVAVFTSVLVCAIVTVYFGANILARRGHHCTLAAVLSSALSSNALVMTPRGRFI